MTILIGILVVVVLCSIVAIICMANRPKEARVYAEIYRDNELLDTIDLTDVDEPYTITYSYGEDDYNIVEVHQGEIGVVEASCPDKLCQQMGFIHNSLMPVTCLPNHLIIRVYTEGEAGATEQTYDGMSY